MGFHRSALTASLSSFLLFSLAACQTVPKTQLLTDNQASSTPSVAAPDPSGNKISDLSPSDLHDVLAELDKGHHDKMRLAFWVGTPLLRSCDPIFKTFYEEQGKHQKELARQLESFAKSHHIDLTYRYTDDVFSQAQKLMEARQEKTVRADNKEDFGRDMLIDEYQDYEFNICLITAFLPHVQDPTLKTYLETSLHSHEAADQEIQKLLKRYKFN